MREISLSNLKIIRGHNLENGNAIYIDNHVESTFAWLHGIVNDQLGSGMTIDIAAIANITAANSSVATLDSNDLLSSEMASNQPLENNNDESSEDIDDTDGSDLNNIAQLWNKIKGNQNNNTKTEQDTMSKQDFIEHESFHASGEKIDLEIILLPKLVEIQRGNVKYQAKSNFKYIHTIDWSQMYSELNLKTVEYPKLNQKARDEYCGSNCPSGCWDKNVCQSINKCNELENGEVCPSKEIGLQPRCHVNPEKMTSLTNYNEYKYSKKDCCHELCAGGCTQPNSPDACFSCAYVKDKGGRTCTRACRGIYTIVPVTLKRLTLPKIYQSIQYGHVCTESCPKNAVAVQTEYGYSCSSSCPERHHSEIVNGELTCNPDIWDDETSGYGIGQDAPSGNYSSHYIYSFHCLTDIRKSRLTTRGDRPKTIENNLINKTNCDMYNYYKNKKRIEGPIRLTGLGFETFQLDPSMMDVFHNLEYISGYLYLQTSSDVDYTELGKILTSLNQLFPNLKQIAGMTLVRRLNAYAGTDKEKQKTSAVVMSKTIALAMMQLPFIKELGLNNLREIFYGNIEIQKTNNLCLDINLEKLVKNPVVDDFLSVFFSDVPDQTINVEETNLATSEMCQARNQKCSDLCDESGCFEFGNSKACLKCRDFTYYDYRSKATDCLNSCDEPYNIAPSLMSEFKASDNYTSLSTYLTPMKTMINLFESKNKQDEKTCCENFQENTNLCGKPCNILGEFTGNQGYCQKCHQNCISCNGPKEFFTPEHCYNCNTIALLSDRESLLLHRSRVDGMQENSSVSYYNGYPTMTPNIMMDATNFPEDGEETSSLEVESSLGLNLYKSNNYDFDADLEQYEYFCLSHKICTENQII